MLGVLEDLELQERRLDRILLHESVLSDALDGVQFISVCQFAAVDLAESALAEDVRDEKVVQFDARVFTLRRKGYGSNLVLVKLRKRLLGFHLAELFFQFRRRRLGRHWFQLFLFFSRLFLLFILLPIFLLLFIIAAIVGVYLTTIAFREWLMEDVSILDCVDLNLSTIVLVVIRERVIISYMSPRGHPSSQRNSLFVCFVILL